MKAMENREREIAGQHQGASMKKGWPWKPLGEVCKTGSGGTPLSSRKEFYEGGNIPWLVSGEVAQGNVREAKNFITKAGLENSAAKLFPKDTVLVAMYGATAGQVGILRFEAATNQAVCGILPNDKFVPEFLFYFLLAKKDDLVAQATGNAQPNISQIKIKNTEVPVPPLAEQQRIVGLLDEAFEGLATAKANAEKNLQNACTLFESYLQSVFTQRGPGWVEKRLEDVCVIGDGNHSSNYPKKEELVAKGVPFIRSTNLVDGEISDEDMRFLSPEKHAQLKKGHLKTGDILFTNRGEIGKTAIVDAGHEGSNLNSQIAWLRCSETLNNRFLFHVLNSGAIKSHLELSKNGAALQQFTIRQIKELKIPIPPKDQQRALVVSLDGLSSETQRLARLYERKLVALEALKRSLLHQAFSGEL